MTDRPTPDAFLDAARRNDVDAMRRMLADDPAIAATRYAVYAAAGIARDPDLTRLLLERGADPNDDETAYHAAETYDNAAVRVLLESGKLNADGLVILLARKGDWHDLDGMRLVLDYGADPNRHTIWRRRTALHHSILRDNRMEMIRLLLDRGADPSIGSDHGTAVQMAARLGRRDVLVEFIHRGVTLDVHGADRVLAACAMDDADTLRELKATEPDAVAAVARDGGEALGGYALSGNLAGTTHLLDLGVPVDVPVPRGDGYWGLADGGTALHAAAWRAHHDIVRLLIERGARVNARDGAGYTPLALAVRACVDSYWTNRRAPHSVAALLHAGASGEGIPLPTGYDEIDALLKQRPG